MNLYDDFQPDIATLLAAQDARLPAPDPEARSGDGLGRLGAFLSVAGLYALGALVTWGLHRRLVYANLRLDWRREFQEYWSGELGCRPIQPFEFYHLAGGSRPRAGAGAFDR